MPLFEKKVAQKLLKELCTIAVKFVLTPQTSRKSSASLLRARHTVIFAQSTKKPRFATMYVAVWEQCFYRRGSKL
jgi:hypothetical protein